MKISIAIVDDEESARQNLTSHLEEYAKSKEVTFAYTYYKTGAEFLFSYENQFDIVFLDIDLGAESGIEIAKEFRKKDENTILIFVTNLRQYAIKGYEVSALNYLLKPIDSASLSLTLDKALLRLQNENKQKIEVHNKNGHFLLDSDSIEYFEVMNHIVMIHTEKEAYKVYDSLKKYEQIVGPQFVKISNYLIVNMNYVDYFSKEEVVLLGKHFKITRGQKKTASKVLSDYFGSSPV